MYCCSKEKHAVRIEYHYPHPIPLKYLVDVVSHVNKYHKTKHNATFVLEQQSYAFVVCAMAG